jgi:hypothetical protein
MPYCSYAFRFSLISPFLSFSLIFAASISRFLSCFDAIIAAIFRCYCRHISLPRRHAMPFHAAAITLNAMPPRAHAALLRVMLIIDIQDSCYAAILIAGLLLFRHCLRLTAILRLLISRFFIFADYFHFLHFAFISCFFAAFATIF